MMGYGHSITVPDLFSAAEANSIIAFKDKGQASGAVVEANAVDERVRKSRVTWINHDDPDAKWIFERLVASVTENNGRFFGLAVTIMERLQLTEYDAAYKGYYGQHIDAPFVPDGAEVRKLSITVQLSAPDDYEGGALKLFTHDFAEPFIADKGLGSATIFRSHIIHQVEPVTRGVRYSLVAWVKGPRPT